MISELYVKILRLLLFMKICKFTVYLIDVLLKHWTVVIFILHSNLK